MKVQGKVIVVTGGGNGIGRELVLGLLARGARVAAIDVSENALRETREVAGSQAAQLETVVADITDRPAVELLPPQVIARFGAVDGLINNAGIIQPFVRLNDLDYGAIERVLRVNLFGTLYMTKAILPHLLERPEAHIANVSSMGGFLPVPGQTVYGAGKAAVKLLTEGLRSELAGTRVGVTVIFPGAIGTNIAANSGIGGSLRVTSQEASFRTTPPATAARVIIDAIEQDRERVLIGRDARLMDLLYRLSPRHAARLVYMQMRALLPG